MYLGGITVDFEWEYEYSKTHLHGLPSILSWVDLPAAGVASASSQGLRVKRM